MTEAQPSHPVSNCQLTVICAAGRGRQIYLLSHQDAPTFKVLTWQAGQTLSNAVTLVPAQADRVIESLRATSDALYVLVRQGVYSHLLRVNPAAGRCTV
jgi:prolyl oligopeptidase